MVWTGRVLSGLIIAFMLFDAIIKLIKIQPVIEGTTKLGYPESTIIPIGLAALVSTILYAFPRTAVLGAILLTGYFGGAIATHLRVGQSSYWFAFAFGVIAWLGIYFRDARLRALFPWQSF
jgi:hypothetical protein